MHDTTRLKGVLLTFRTPFPGSLRGFEECPQA